MASVALPVKEAFDYRLRELDVAKDLHKVISAAGINKKSQSDGRGRGGGGDECDIQARINHNLIP